jgi:hypothetical protein
MDGNSNGAWPEAAVAELRWLVEEGRPVAEIARRLRRSEREVRGAIEAHRLWPYASAATASARRDAGARRAAAARDARPPLLGECVVLGHGLSRSGLMRAVLRQRELAAQGRRVLLGQLLVEMGLAERAWVEEALRVQRLAQGRAPER